MNAPSSGNKEHTVPKPQWQAVSGRILWTVAGVITVLLLSALQALWREQRDAEEHHASEQLALWAQQLEQQATRTLDAAADASAVVADRARTALGPATTAEADAPPSASNPAVQQAPNPALNALLNPSLSAAVGPALQAALAQHGQLIAMAVVAADGRVLEGAGALRTGERLALAAWAPLPSAGPGRLLPPLPTLRAGNPDQAGPAATAAPSVSTAAAWVQRVATAQGELLVLSLFKPGVWFMLPGPSLEERGLAAALLTADGQRLAASGRPDAGTPSELRTLPPLASGAPPGGSGNWIGRGLRAGERLGSYRAMREYPLWVMVDTDRQTLTDKATARLSGFAAAALLSIAAVLGLSALLARALDKTDAASRRWVDAQNRLAQRNQELDAVFTSVRELLFRTDAEGRLQLVNARWSSATGLQPGACIGQPLIQWVAVESRLAVENLLRPQPDTLPRHAEIFIDTPTGRCRYEMTVVALLEGNTLQGFAGSAVDITELVNTQLKLREQLAFNEALIENNPLPVVVRDLENRYLRVNSAWEAFTGKPRHGVVGTQAELQHAPELAAVHAAKDHELMAQRRGKIRYEAKVMRADGQLRDVLVSKALICDGHDAMLAIVGSFTDISELREAERITRLARDAAESASAAKTEFIANISHELRTPLQAVLGFSELGEMRSAHEPKFNSMFVDIHQGGQRMLSLVNELLDLSKLDRTSLQLSRESFALRSLLEQAVSELHPLAQAKNLTLSIHGPPEPGTLHVDTQRIAQVLRNLLANAIRFSPADGPIELLAREHWADDGVPGLIVTVADRGPGIPPDELDSIFEPFVQSSLTKDGSGGTGLGLAIARRIVQAHGGWLRARNRDGGGAAFQLWLPLAEAENSAPA